MDCNTARLLLHFAHPCTTELEGNDANALESHLAECLPCGALAQAERRADNRISQAMRAVAVPAGLRQRLLTQLDAERDAWYRRRLLRGAAAVAAAAAMIFGLWLAVDRSNRPPPIDLQAVGQEVWSEIINPSPASVEEGFQRRGIKMVAPSENELNYRLFRYYGVATIQGKRVPLLLYTSNNEQARVYVFSSRDFDLRAAVDNGQIMESGYKVEVLPHPWNSRDPQYAFVIVYTGDSLDRFRPTGP